MKYVQEWFDYIGNVKTLWLVTTVLKNVANFVLIYEWLFGLTRNLKFLDLKRTFINELQSVMNYTITLKKLKFCG